MAAIIVVTDKTEGELGIPIEIVASQTAAVRHIDGGGILTSGTGSHALPMKPLRLTNQCMR